MGLRDYKYKWVSKLECNVNQYLVGKAEDWPQISGESMLNIMVEKDRHYWPSGCSTQVHNLQEVFDKVKEQIKKRK